MPKHLRTTSLRFLSRTLKSRTCLVLLSLAISSGGEADHNVSILSQLIGPPKQGDVSIVNGIKGASYCNSGHTGPQMKEPYKYLAA